MKHSTFHLINWLAYHLHFCFNKWTLRSRGARVHELVLTQVRLSTAVLWVWFAFLFPIPSLDLFLPLTPTKIQSILCWLLNFQQDHYTQSMLSSVFPGKLINRMGTLGNKPALCYNQEFWVIHKSTSRYNTHMRSIKENNVCGHHINNC